MIRETREETISGYCDYLSSNHSIDVTYIKVPILSSRPGAKAHPHFYCTHMSECNLEIDCPIYKKAINKSIW